MGQVGKLKKIIFLFVLGVGVIWAFKVLGLGDYLSFSYLKSNASQLRAQVESNFLLSAAIYFSLYVLVAAFSLPGAAVLTLAGGALFGFGRGLLLVSFASTLGATIAFLLSRYLLKDWVEKKFGAKIQTIQEGIKKDGALYIFSLRLVPLFPFFLVNLLMGLTPIRTWTYYWVSQIGMLAGTAAFVNAGTELSKIDSLGGIVSPGLLGAFVALGLLPLFSKWILEGIKKRKVYAPYSIPKRFDYNLIVIGAGSGGLVSSYIAATLKARVALIEKHKMGGDCLNTGCVPSKALIKSAKVAHMSRKLSEYGIEGSETKVNFAKVMERVSGVIKKIEPHDSVERYSSLGVECIEGSASLESPFEVQVNGKTLTAKNIVVATGARPLVPKIPGLDQVPHYTSDTVWSLRERPERLLVLGGGPIGCELAQSFARLGTKVTQVEMAPRLMGREDPDVSLLIEATFRHEGIDVRCSHKALEFSRRDDRNILKCESQSGSQSNIVEIEFDTVLLALGRVANTKGFGLEKLGIEISPRGTISHDPFLRTKYPNIYVCGDVAGPYQFTHAAAHQAWYAAVNALLSPFIKFKADYRVIPWCTFSDPEVARVGINETEAREQKLDVDVVKYGIDDLDRAIADSEDEGFVKVITQKGSDKILGATIVGSHAGDMITEFVSAMKHNIGFNKILGTIHIYPTHSEANKYAAGLWKQKNKPEALLRWVEKFHSWRRG